MIEQELEVLREQIDQLDQQLLDLVRQRMSLVAEVGVVKHKAGLPIYVPEREAKMLAKRRAEAEALGIPPQLIEDVLRRFMRESYHSEKDKGFKQVNPQVRSVVVIGGHGVLGRLFVQMFRLSGYQVEIIDQEDWQRAPEVFAQASLVIVSVPIHLTCALIQQELTQLPSDCILADLTSIKSEPLTAMLASHQGPVVGLHPMFGPDVKSFAKQVIVLCHGRFPEQYQWLIEQIQIWGAKLVEVSATEHDQSMQLVQAMRHFSTFVYGLNLYRQQADLGQLVQLSSPIYRLELAMVGRLFAQDPNLYADIIFSQKQSQRAMKSYLASYQEGLIWLEQGDRDLFIRQFNEVKAWFGELAEQFRDESGRLLQSMNDQHVWQD